MGEAEVGRVLDALDAAGVRAWVEGGWGIDALVGRSTREHDDLDLAVDAGAGGFDAAVAALETLGYGPTLATCRSASWWPRPTTGASLIRVGASALPTYSAIVKATIGTASTVMRVRGQEIAASVVGIGTV